MNIVHAVIHDQALATILLVAVLASLLDLVSGVLAALRTHTFEFYELAAFVQTHILERVIPIAALATFASVLSATLAGGVPANAQTAVLASLPDVVWLAAWAAITAYVLEVLASLGVNVPTAVKGL